MEKRIYKPPHFRDSEAFYPENYRFNEISIPVRVQKFVFEVHEDRLKISSYNLRSPFKYDSRCALFSLLSFVTTNSTPQKEAQRMSYLKEVQILQQSPLARRVQTMCK